MIDTRTVTKQGMSKKEMKAIYNKRYMMTHPETNKNTNERLKKTKIFCDCCKRFYNMKQIYRHRKSIKHKLNFEKLKNPQKVEMRKKSNILKNHVEVMKTVNWLKKLGAI